MKRGYRMSHDRTEGEYQESKNAGVRRMRRTSRSARPILAMLPIVLATALIAGCSSGSGGNSSSGSDSDIKIMVLAPLTLASSPFQGALDGVQARIDMENAAGGINGHQVKVIGCDSQNDVNVAAQCARKAVSEHAAALVGSADYTGSTIWPIIESAGIPSIGLRQVTQLDNTNKFAFPIDASGPLTYGVAGAYLVKNQGCKTVGWMGVDYGAASQSAIAQSKAAVAKVGGQWGATQLFAATAADLAPQAAVALKDGNCFILAAGNLSPRSAQALYAINPNVKMIGTPDSLGGYLGSNYGASAVAVTQLSSMPSMDSDAPGVVAFKTQMGKDKPKTTLNNTSLRGWGGADVFIDIAKAVSGDVTPSAVYNTLLKSTNVTTDGVTSPIDFSTPKPFGDITRQFNTSFSASLYQNGKLVERGNGLFDGLALING
jgi:ABC-type branched-subunit amino acid transport system substrate-binding protein